MATQTPNYGLHQWEPSDNFLRTDFNTDFQKIDTALGQMADRTELNTRCSIVTGTYTGNDAASRQISLGFLPKAVFLQEDQSEEPWTIFVTENGGPLMDNYTKDRAMLNITSEGFQVKYDKYKMGSLSYPYTPHTNLSGMVYRYVAVRQ